MAARPTATEVARHVRFRARPWPVAVGSKADLLAKREAQLARSPHTFRSENVFVSPSQAEACSKSPALDFDWLLTYLEVYIGWREARSSGSTALWDWHSGPHFDLFAQESWRSQVFIHCYLPVDEDQLMNTEADVAFEELKECMLSPDWQFESDICVAVRALLVWLMRYDLDGLEFLMREGPLHVGRDFFPPCTHEWQSLALTGGEAESLLSLAAKDAGSPEAVRLLLDHGANPNGELAPRSFNGGYLPTCGPGGLACLDVRNNDWPTSEKLDILTALANAGGDMCDALSEYDGRNKEKHKAEFELCAKLFSAQIERDRTAARQRLETLVALVGIVSFWRRCAAAPDSKAAKAAVARATKRARAWVSG